MKDDLAQLIDVLQATDRIAFQAVSQVEATQGLAGGAQLGPLVAKPPVGAMGVRRAGALGVPKHALKVLLGRRGYPG